MQKIIKIILLAFFCISVSCAKNNNQDLSAFMLSELPHIQALEKVDHFFCSSLKLEFNKNNDALSRLYWHCRMSMAKSRLTLQSNIPSSQNNNPEFVDLVSRIALKLASTPEANLIRQIKKLDDHHHRQCLIMGFEIETEDQAKIDEYFSCRKILIQEQQLIPPFGNEAYLKHANRSYDLSFAIDARVDLAVQFYNESKKKYPTCIKYNLRGTNFKLCTAAQDKARSCLSKTDSKKFKKESDEKVICQKKAYLRFPDRLLKENEAAKKDIERTRSNSDYYNQHNFASLGIDDKKFLATPAEAKKNALDLREQEEKAINSKDGLYNKFELTKLRQKFISSCINAADINTAEYVRSYIISCKELEKFEVQGVE